MLRSILVGLDGSEHSDSALELGIRWARRFDALLVGIGVVDEPGIHGPEEYLVGEAYFRRLNTALLADTRRERRGVAGAGRPAVAPRRAWRSRRWRTSGRRTSRSSWRRSATT